MCVSVSPTALVAVILLYTLFLLASVPHGYLLGFSDTLIANPYVRTLTISYMPKLLTVNFSEIFEPRNGYAEQVEIS